MQSTLLGEERQLLNMVPTVRASTLLAAQRAVGGVLSEHRLATEDRGALDVEMRVAKVGTLPIISLHYGAAVTIEPRQLADHVLFQVVLSGCISVQSASGLHVAYAGDGLLLENLGQCRLHWSSGSRQIIVRLPRAALARATGAAPDGRVGFKPVFALDEGSGGTLHLVRYLLSQAGSARSADFGSTAEDLLVRQLLVEHARVGIVADAAPGCVVRAERHMRQNLASPLSIETVAAAARTKPRTLTENFSRFRKRSPMAWLRDLRLDAVRADLQSGRGGSITEVATRYHFYHLGRFSALYRQRFGELPSATSAIG